MTDRDSAGPARSSDGAGRAVPALSTSVSDHFAHGAIRPHLVRSALFLSFIVFFATLSLIGLTFSTLAALAQVGVRVPDLGSATDSFLSLMGLGGIVVFGLGWLISLFISVQEFLDESAVLVEGASGEAASVYAAVLSALDIKVLELTVEDGRTAGSRTVRVSAGEVWAMIIVREVGPHLHIGATMWRTRSTVRLLGRVFADLTTGSGQDDSGLVEASMSAALRELVHAALRHGLSTAGRE